MIDPSKREWVTCQLCQADNMVDSAMLDNEGNWICGESYNLICFEDMLKKFGELL